MASLKDDARVLAIYTGGTIGMLRSDAGFVPHPGFLAQNLRSQARFHDEAQDSVFANSGSVAAFSNWTANAASRVTSGTSTPVHSEPIDTTQLSVRTTSGTKLLPSLVTPRSAQGKRIRYAILEYETLIDSAEVELADWVRIATDIELNYSLYDSFVVLHGTDTMAYSASALSFLLEDLGKTVILTGAQIPLSELLNDSLDNLLGALIVAGHYRLPEVCLYFDHKLLRGNRSTKISSDEFNAFASPSLPPLATVGIDIDVAWAEVLRPGLKAFKAHKSMSKEVATLRIFPGITGSAVRAFLSGDIKGLVLESYGAGNAPKREELLSAFREASERGVVIVNVSQCATGAVAEIYETGKALAAVGIVGGEDMTVECALAKLAYLLSKPDLSPAQVRKLIGRPLRGELTLSMSSRTFASAETAQDRLRHLFTQVVECAPPTTRGTRSMGERTRSVSGSDFITSPIDAPIPAEYSPPWPSTQRDAIAAEEAIFPYLLGQATSRAGPLLLGLIDTLGNPKSTSENNSAPVAIALLSEPCTPSLQTPLHLAVLAVQPANVNLLLANGASVHARDILAHSALYYAARLGTAGLEMVQALRKAGAHLGEQEIERGAVGLELARAKRLGAEAYAVWTTAAGISELERAEAALRGFVGV